MCPFLIQLCSNLFWMMQNYPNFLPNVFLCQNSQILGVFFGFVCEKSWTAGQINLKLGMQKLYILFWKKLENNNFIRAAVHCEFYIWNIQIFANFFSLPGSKQNYLDSFFKGSGQLVPSIWFAACLNRNWFFGNLTAAEICFQLIPKYKLKVKLQRR